MILSGLLFSSKIFASELGVYYKNFTLEDTETSETAQGVNLLGVRGNLFDVLDFKFERALDEEQKSLTDYMKQTTELENYVSKIDVGLQLLVFTHIAVLENLYIEYIKDVYQLQYDSDIKFYTQELFFLGLKSRSADNGVSASFGLFQHNNEKEILVHDTGKYSRYDTKNVYGLMVQADDVFLPYESGTPIGLSKYGTGVLIDDLKVQYQVSGGDDYFFSVALGLAHRSVNFNVYVKYGIELTTDTMANKILAGADYRF